MSTPIPAVSAREPDADELLARIETCMLADRRTLERRVAKARPRGVQALRRVARDIERSAARLRARLAQRLRLEYPPELPISPERGRIAAAIASSPVTIVSGATGSGKTTQLPKICLEAGRGTAGLVGHTQPRRVAARSVAGRIARETGTALGNLVGYQVRFNTEVSQSCRVKLMTDGILLAEIHGDPRLWAYDTIIVDEAHERSLNVDFLLGYLKRLLAERPDLKVVVSSATIDTERFSRYLDGAPVIEVSGRGYPVEVRYREAVTGRDPEAPVRDAVAEAVADLCDEGPGDVLVFLPTERDIRDAGERLRRLHLPHTEILPLYARLPLSRQERVFEPHDGRRIVLATNVAETSLTVPGVRAVVDTGLARISRYSHRSAVQRLPVEPVSRASADQRLGRCGRTGPGVCVRLYSRDDYEGRPAFTEPEIRRSNLAAVLLRLRALDIDDIDAFPFLDAPDRRHVNDGHRLLRELGALDADDRLTRLGRTLARLPLDPRVGRMLIEAGKQRCVREILVLAAALGVGDPRERPAGAEAAAGAAQERYADGRSDFMTLLKVWQHVRSRPRRGGSWTAFCRRHFLSPARLREWQDVHEQLRDAAREIGLRSEQGPPASYGRIHRALLSGLLRHVGSRSGPREYQGVRDVTFVLSPGSGQHAARPRWVVAGELVETSRLYAFLVASIRPEWVERAAGDLLRRTHFEAHWDAERSEAMVYEQTSLHGLTLVPRRRVRYAPVSRADAREIFIRSGLVEGRLAVDAGWLEHNRGLVARLRYLDHKLRRPDVAVSDATVFDFYDALLPDEVCDGHGFDVWWRRCERESPQRLRMVAEDVATGPLPDFGADFPDVLSVRGLSIPLHYRFAPGDPDDGITATVTTELLPELHPEDFEWLVPGRLEEKVVALLRSLPKSIRREVQPLTGIAAEFVGIADASAGTLLGSLRGFLRVRAGIDVPEDAWRAAGAGREIPPHLLMRFRVNGEEGGPATRDLAELQLRHGRAPAGTGAPRRPGELLGLREWPLERLPEPADEIRDGLRVRKYPALLDRGDGVDLAWFESPERARAATGDGVLRLFMLAAARDLRRARRAVSDLDEVELRCALLAPCPLRTDGAGEGPEPREDIERAIAVHAFVDDPARVRTRERFEAECAHARLRLERCAAEIGRLARDILARYRAVRELRDAPGVPAAAAEDVDGQLAHLVYRGFLAGTPAAALAHLPRYLDALALRLRKLARGGARDSVKLAEVAPLWQRYLLRRAEHAARGRRDPQLARYRWMLEEFRVSLFAQELGTAQPISRKRLDAQWQSVSS